jgi:Na+/melibiose symporter-like transporter
MATISLRTPVIYTIFPFIAAFAASLFLIEPKYDKSASSSMLSHIRESARELLSNRQLFLLVLAYLLFEAFGESVHQISQIFYAFNEIPVKYFGFIFATLFGLSALGALISHDVSEMLGEKRTLIVSTLFSMLGLFAATCTRGWIAVAFLVSGSIFFGIRNPIMSHMTNMEIESSNRATILSIRNLAISAGFALFAPALGLLTDTKGIIAGYRIFAGMFLIIIFIQFLLKEGD